MNKQEPYLQLYYYLLENDELDLIDAVLLSKIISYKDNCFISNAALGLLVGINDKNVSRRLSKLKSMGYINIVERDKHTGNSKRTIYATYENGLSLKASRVVATDKGVLSLTARGIVADDKGLVSLPTNNNITILNEIIRTIDNINYKINKIDTTPEERNKLLKELHNLKLKQIEYEK